MPRPPSNKPPRGSNRVNKQPTAPVGSRVLPTPTPPPVATTRVPGEPAARNGAQLGASPVPGVPPVVLKSLGYGERGGLPSILPVPASMLADDPNTPVISEAVAAMSTTGSVDDLLERAELNDLLRYANSTEAVPLLREKAKVMLAIHARAERNRGERYLSPIAHRVKQQLWLDAYVGGQSTITAACKAVGIATTQFYKWLGEDAIFARDYCNARETAVDELVMEAKRRAVTGVEKAVGWYQGVPGGTEMQYSDGLLMFLLRGMRPDVFDAQVRAGLVKDANSQHGAATAADNAAIPFERMSAQAQLEIAAIIERELGIAPVDTTAVDVTPTPTTPPPSTPTTTLKEP